MRVGDAFPTFCLQTIHERRFVRDAKGFGMRPEVLEKMVIPVPLRRIGEPEEMYMTVKFIIENDYFTGRTIDVDGGLLLS